MKQTINRYQFDQAFRDMDRVSNFEYEGLNVLFDYLEQYEQDTGEEIELDVIGLCCDYSHDTWQEIADNYNIDLSECADGMCTASQYGLDQIEKAKKECVREYLENKTTVCGETSTGFVYGIF